MGIMRDLFIGGHIDYADERMTTFARHLVAKLVTDND